MPITRLALALFLAALTPAVLTAAPRESRPGLDPRQLSALPSYVRGVEPAIVGLQVEVPRDRPSALTLGAERRGSGVISKLWQGGVEQEVQVVVQRDRGFEAITVRPIDRYRFYRMSGD